MRYKKFRIQNYKGIKDTTVDLSSQTNANVFALVGLNESGKTTVLEAIHSFSPDYRTKQIVGESESGEGYENIVPRHKFSTFTGDIVVSAVLILDKSDKEYIARNRRDENFVLNVEEIPDEIETSVVIRFSRGDFVKRFRTVSGQWKVRSPKGKVWREATADQLRLIASRIYMRTPDVAYYPTFIFDFPEKIWLSARGSTVSQFYKSVFGDILTYGGADYSIQKDIINRVRADKFTLPFLEFLNEWRDDSNKEKIRHVIDHAQKTVTQVVFGRWNEIFKENAKDREVIVEFDIDEGRKRNDEGKMVTTEQHDPYVKFRIKDGTRRFDVNDRSLGFRWFFSFLLFTQFRSAKDGFRPILFLFDEPASNLHAAAQSKLVEAFPEIARGPHMLMYSTHSHYMIDPKWLEQTFIVTNQADNPNASVMDAALLDDESIDVRVERYRTFSNSNPNQTSYFQPIIDKLDVVPSKFDYSLPSVVLEGKSDFYILEYAKKLLGKDDLRLVPGLGAGSFEALIGISVGWGTKFVFLLDSDCAGEKERLRYAADLGAPTKSLVTIGDLGSSLKEIEDLFDSDALAVVKSVLGLSKKPGKKDILRFSQEMLAKGECLPLGEHFSKNSEAILSGLSSRLDAL